jgi:hypothetical protein
MQHQTRKEDYIIMAKKNNPVEVEETPVAQEKWERYYADNIYEDEDEIITIAGSASRVIRDRFGIRIEDPKLLTAVFLKITETFINKLSDMEKNYKEFTLNLADRLAIGFTNNDGNEEDEKSGNFMIFMNHIGGASKVDDLDDPTVSCQERAVQWNAENVVKQPEMIRVFSEEATKKLRDIDIQLSNKEVIMPIFITFYESIINYLKIRRREEDVFEKFVNFSWFIVYCRESDDVNDTILIRPTIGAKLALKNDQNASSENE